MLYTAHARLSVILRSLRIRERRRFKKIESFGAFWVVCGRGKIKRSVAAHISNAGIGTAAQNWYYIPIKTLLGSLHQCRLSIRILGIYFGSAPATAKG